MRDNYCGLSRATDPRSPCGTHADKRATSGPPLGYNLPDRRGTNRTKQVGVKITLPKNISLRTRSTHMGATRPAFSYSESTPIRITSRPELSISYFDAVCVLACPSRSSSSSYELLGSIPTIISWYVGENTSVTAQIP